MSGWGPLAKSKRPVVALIKLRAQVSKCFAASGDVPINLAGHVHPCLGKTHHDIALTGVGGFVRPAQALERKLTHFVGGDHPGAPVAFGAGARPVSQPPAPRDGPSR